MPILYNGGGDSISAQKKPKVAKKLKKTIKGKPVAPAVPSAVGQVGIFGPTPAPVPTPTLTPTPPLPTPTPTPYQLGQTAGVYGVTPTPSAVGQVGVFGPTPTPSAVGTIGTIPGQVTPSPTPAIPTVAQPVVQTGPAGGGPIPPATAQALQYLDRIRSVDPERALEQARFQSATISRNAPDTALATNVFFTEHGLYDLGQLPRTANERVFDVIASRAGAGSGADLLTRMGYINLGTGLWYKPEGIMTAGNGTGGGLGRGGGALGGGGGGTIRLGGFGSNQSGGSRFSGGFGLVNWRI